MKGKIFLFIFIALSQIVAQAQPGKVAGSSTDAPVGGAKMSTIDTYIAVGAYQQAAVLLKDYVEKHEKNVAAKYKLGETYLKARDYRNAALHFKGVYDNLDKDIKLAFPAAGYYYAKMLVAIAQYEQAKNVYNGFIAKNDNSSDAKIRSLVRAAKTEAKGCDLAVSEYKGGIEAVVDNAGANLNGSYTDGAPSYINNKKLLYASLKATVPINIGDVNTYKSKIYEFNLGANNTTILPEVINDKAFNIGGACLNPSGKNLYFTKCNPDKNNVMHCELYVSEIKNGVYGVPIRLEEGVNGKDFSVSMPFVVDAGRGDDKIYFASNRTGGAGGYDIWTVVRHPQGDCEKITNVMAINTAGDELSPFLSKKEVLYFSSDGHAGFGGLDIFSYKNVEQEAIITNVGKPINGSTDDFYFVTNSDETSGFMVSNRNGAQVVAGLAANSGDDLFSVAIVDKKLAETIAEAKKRGEVPVIGAFKAGENDKMVDEIPIKNSNTAKVPDVPTETPVTITTTNTIIANTLVDGGKVEITRTINNPETKTVTVLKSISDSNNKLVATVTERLNDKNEITYFSIESVKDAIGNTVANIPIAKENSILLVPEGGKAVKVIEEKVGKTNTVLIVKEIYDAKGTLVATVKEERDSKGNIINASRTVVETKNSAAIVDNTTKNGNNGNASTNIDNKNANNGKANANNSNANANNSNDTNNNTDAVAKKEIMLDTPMGGKVQVANELKNSKNNTTTITKNILDADGNLVATVKEERNNRGNLLAIVREDLNKEGLVTAITKELHPSDGSVSRTREERDAKGNVVATERELRDATGKYLASIREANDTVTGNTVVTNFTKDNKGNVLLYKQDTKAPDGSVIASVTKSTIQEGEGVATMPGANGRVKVAPNQNNTIVVDTDVPLKPKAPEGCMRAILYMVDDESLLKVRDIPCATDRNASFLLLPKRKYMFVLEREGAVLQSRMIETNNNTRSEIYTPVLSDRSVVDKAVSTNNNANNKPATAINTNPKTSAATDVVAINTAKTNGSNAANDTAAKVDATTRPVINTAPIVFRGTVFIDNKGSKVAASSSRVSLYSMDGIGKVTILQTKTLDGGPTFSFPLNAGKPYRIVAVQNGYLTASVELTAEPNAPELIQELILRPIKAEVAYNVSNIYYEFKSKELTPEAMLNLEGLINTLTDNPSVVVEISAHTDNVGSSEFNQQLSQLRAQSVVDYLIRKGIAANRLTARGYGEEKPIAPNTKPNGSDDPEGRARNRRTEFRVIGEVK